MLDFIYTSSMHCTLKVLHGSRIDRVYEIPALESVHRTYHSSGRMAQKALQVQKLHTIQVAALNVSIERFKSLDRHLVIVRATPQLD